MDRRVQIVRFWTLAVIGLVLCCFAPEAVGVLVYGGYALTPVGLFMPVFGPSCTIFSDTFATDQIATKYTVSSGTWAVSGGVLSTSSSSAKIMTNDTTDGAATGAKVSATITLSTTSDTGRLHLGGDWFMEVQPGATNGTLKIFEGVNQRGLSAIVYGYTGGAIAACFSVGNGFVTASAGNCGAWYEASPSMASVAGGMGTGSGGGATFDNFVLGLHESDLEGCGFCFGGACPATPQCCDQFPAAFQAVITGFSNNTCTTCGDFNRTVIVYHSSTCGYVSSTQSGTFCRVAGPAGVNYLLGANEVEASASASIVPQIGATAPSYTGTPTSVSGSCTGASFTYSEDGGGTNCNPGSGVFSAIA